MGIGVHFLRLVGKLLVDRGNFKVNRRVNVGYGFHRLDGAEALSLGEGRPDLRQLRKRDVSEFLGGKLGDADPVLAVNLRDVLMGLLKPESCHFVLLNICVSIIKIPIPCN